MEKCFVISPIGEDASQTRRQSDLVFEYIIIPALLESGFEKANIHRVDKSDRPAHITTEIIGNLVHYDLVIADLSELNANVFYELGIRHAFKKPCILISDWKNRPPFDVSGTNVIRYVHDDVASHLACRNRIKAQVTDIRLTDSVSNPVTVALGFERLSEDGDDVSKLIVSLSEKVESLQGQISELQSAEAKRSIVSQILRNSLDLGAPKINALAGYMSLREPTLGDLLSEVNEGLMNSNPSSEPDQ